MAHNIVLRLLLESYWKDELDQRLDLVEQRIGLLGIMLLRFRDFCYSQPQPKCIQKNILFLTSRLCLLKLLMTGLNHCFGR